MTIDDDDDDDDDDNDDDDDDDDNEHYVMKMMMMMMTTMTMMTTMIMARMFWLMMTRTTMMQGAGTRTLTTPLDTPIQGRRIADFDNEGECRRGQGEGDGEGQQKGTEMARCKHCFLTYVSIWPPRCCQHHCVLWAHDFCNTAEDLRLRHLHMKCTGRVALELATTGALYKTKSWRR